MKQHLVNLWFDTPIGNFTYCGLVNEVLGDNNKPIIYVNSLFKQLFGFELPQNSTITFL